VIGFRARHPTVNSERHSANRLTAELVLKISHSVPQPDAKGFGDSQESINRNGPVRSLDLAYVNGMQIGLLRQYFLSHRASLAELADILADSFVCLRAGHFRYGSSFTRDTP
jgi:hypothetical protein